MRHAESRDDEGPQLLKGAAQGTLIIDGTTVLLRRGGDWKLLAQSPISRHRSSVWERLRAHVSKLSRGMKA